MNSEVTDNIHEIIENLGLGGVDIGVYARNFNTNKEVFLGKDRSFGLASVVKLPIALALFDKASRGGLDLDSPVDLKNHNQSDLGRYSNGALAFLPKQSGVSLRLACYFMLSMSDNAATNLVLNYVEKDEVNNYLNKNGWKKTVLTADTIDPKKLEEEGNFLGSSSAWEIAKIMEGVLGGENDYGKDVSSMLEESYPGPYSSRYLPMNWNVSPSRQKIKSFYRKGGSFPKFDLLTEVFGIKTDKDEIIAGSVLTQGIKNTDGKDFPANLNVEHPGQILISKLSRLIFDYLY